MKQLFSNLNNTYSSFFKNIFKISFVILLMTENANAQNELDVIRNNCIQYRDATNSLYQ